MPDDARANRLLPTATNAPFWPAAERLLSLPPEWRIRRNGSFAWLDPTPSFEWYRAFYNSEYRRDRTHSGLLHDQAVRDRKRAYFARRIDRIITALGRSPSGIVDIGAGDGMFLAAAAEAGHRVMGVELCAEAAKAASEETGVKVLTGDLLLDELSLPMPVDVVQMHHVFEHLLRPMDYLRAVRDLLEPDGLFVFEIPQQFINPIDLAYRALGRQRPFDAYSLHHPYFYTVASIRRMLDMAGYRIVSLRTWLPGQVFHVDNRLVGGAMQSVLWLADRIAKKGHVIEVMARPE